MRLARIVVAVRHGVAVLLDIGLAEADRIDLRTRLQRQHLAATGPGIVLQQNHRLLLNLKALGAAGLCADRATGLAGIHVGVFEQAELELLLEQALGRFVDTCLGD